MITVERPIRFEDVDAAGLVFFARYLHYAHEAMERFFDAAFGGYVGLINDRKIGFPAVHVTADFDAPLRYGDVALIDVAVTQIGQTSCTFAYTFRRARDGVNVAALRHVVVATDLQRIEKVDLPADVRVVLEAHLQR